MASIARKVTSVKQSPLNPKQWNLQLDCGHDVWTTAKRRPTKQTAPCERCQQTTK
jgi:hypothetical protein